MEDPNLNINAMDSRAVSLKREIIFPLSLVQEMKIDFQLSVISLSLRLSNSISITFQCISTLKTKFNHTFDNINKNRSKNTQLNFKVPENRVRDQNPHANKQVQPRLMEEESIETQKESIFSVETTNDVIRDNINEEIDYLREQLHRINKSDSIIVIDNLKPERRSHNSKQPYKYTHLFCSTYPTKLFWHK